MAPALFATHILGIAFAALAGRRTMRAGLATAAVAPLATALWATTAIAARRPADTWTVTWVEGLDLSFAFRTDSLALLMTLLVAGIGALVFVYAAGYFAPDAPGGTRFPPTLLAFSTSMLGLVWADSIWTLFIFWELTSVTSFLLVGHKHTDPDVRTAARRAFVITAAGGLVLLAGLIVLTDRTGSASLSDLVPIDGTAGIVAAVLVLVGAGTKSAQVPFHVWLPGAMAAPTPVSAYLHSATMVKAGVLLVAVLAPAFSDVATWKWLGYGFGIASIFWGALGALRQRDAKLILAWGTVSQLGLLVTLLAVGSAKATFAAIAILFAHALFKAALFLVVGEVDIRTGTRDIDRLGGLHRSMPVTFGVALAAALSMAGVPPLLGFAAKEAAIEAVLGLDRVDRAVVGVAIIGGSVLTVAYTLRFMLGVFGRGPTTGVAQQRAAMTVPAVILSVAGVVGFIAIDLPNSVIGPAATELDPRAGVYQLIRFPGLEPAFLISMAIVATGSVLGFVLARSSRHSPRPVGARMADDVIDGVLRAAPRLIARVQHGSLPVYVATMGAVVVVAAMPFATSLSFDHLVWWDHPLQAVLALAIVGAGIAGVLVESRLAAALTLGAVGIGMSGMFVLHGAPDLALTQLLVETIVVVGFVLGLGHLARRFPEANDAWRFVRMTVAGGCGAAVMIGLVAAGSDPTGVAPVDDLAAAAVAEGGGRNIVNVILTDIRALDTLGEVVVLAVVAVGVLALARRSSEAAAG